MSDLVGNPEDRFSNNEAHLVLLLLIIPSTTIFGMFKSFSVGKSIVCIYVWIETEYFLNPEISHRSKDNGVQLPSNQ